MGRKFFLLTEQYLKDLINRQKMTETPQMKQTIDLGELINRILAAKHLSPDQKVKLLEKAKAEFLDSRGRTNEITKTVENALPTGAEPEVGAAPDVGLPPPANPPPDGGQQPPPPPNVPQPPPPAPPDGPPKAIPVKNKYDVLVNQQLDPANQPGPSNEARKVTKGSKDSPKRKKEAPNAQPAAPKAEAAAAAPPIAADAQPGNLLTNVTLQKKFQQNLTHPTVMGGRAVGTIFRTLKQQNKLKVNPDTNQLIYNNQPIADTNFKKIIDTITKTSVKKEAIEATKGLRMVLNAILETDINFPIDQIQNHQIRSDMRTLSDQIRRTRKATVTGRGASRKRRAEWNFQSIAKWKKM